MSPRLQDAFWPADGVGGAIRIERHFGREMRCFAERPAHVDAMFQATVRRYGSREALVAGALRLDYRALDARVDCVAANLSRRGVRAVDRHDSMPHPNRLAGAMAAGRIILFPYAKPKQ